MARCGQDWMRWRFVLFGLTLGGPAIQAREPGDPLALAERIPAGQTTHVVAELKASGELRPAGLPGAKDPEPVPVRVDSRFDFVERILDVTAGGTPQHALRYARQAAAAINTPGRPVLVQIRPAVSTLLVTLENEQAITASPGGPLTRQELDIVQAAADPLLLGLLLPVQAVSVGETWPIPAAAARALADYEAIASNSLRARLESADEATATIHIGGIVRGAARGGEGTMNLDGTLTFDRRQALVTRFELQRDETRSPGHVEAGLAVKGRLTITRNAIGTPPELADAVVASLPAADAPALRLLRYSPPRGEYALLHDRNWHLYWEDERLAILKRLDQGELVSQLNLARGPDAGAGRHQDLAQFRKDIQEALDKRFTRFAGAGEVEGTAPGFRYKVTAQGTESNRDVLFHYFLLASPDGRQLLATFTQNLADRDRLGTQDLEIVGSLEWLDPPAAAAETSASPAAGLPR